MPSSAGPETIVHATCVAIGKRGLLITGPSASGKSALGLALMALGARLVADDRTRLAVRKRALVASCPAPIRGLIEARGIGLIRAGTRAWVRVRLVVDLGQTETDRLPPPRHTTLCGIECGLVFGQQQPHFPAVLLAYMMGGRQA